LEKKHCYPKATSLKRVFKRRIVAETADSTIGVEVKLFGMMGGMTDFVQRDQPHDLIL
jgi:hypothetical protein